MTSSTQPTDPTAALTELELTLTRAASELSVGGTRPSSLFLGTRVVDETRQAVVLVDEESEIVRVSDAAAALLGLERDRVMGMTIGEALRCENSFSREGCGRGVACGSCVLRNAVAVCLRGAERVLDRSSEITSRAARGPLRRRISLSAIGLGSSQASGDRYALAVIHELRTIGK